MTLRAFALGATLAIHVVFAWLVFAPRAVTEPEPRVARTGTMRDADDVRATSSHPAATRDRAPHPARARRFEPGEPAAHFSTPEERAAYERGEAYEIARREALARWRRKQYGEDVGALMALPAPQAWNALEALAAEGDDAAAGALYELSACAVEIPGRDDTYRRLRDSAVSGLAPVDAAFVHGALDVELLGIEADARMCTMAGLDEHRLTALAERRLRALDRWTPPPHGDERHAWIRYYQSAFPPLDEPRDPASRATASLSERLESRALQDDESWSAFEAAAWDEPSLVIQVAYCALAECASIPPSVHADAARWIDRAASLGHTQSISHVIEQQTAARDLAEAHAWAEFGMWVVASGCHPIAQSLEYAQLARQRHQLAGRLTPVQFAEARVRLAGLMREHGDAALSAQGCGP